MTESRRQHVGQLVQHHMARLRWRQPSDRGDLHQRQRFNRLPASPHPVQWPKAAPARPGPEHHLHLAQRVRGRRALPAHRRGDRGQVVLVGDDPPHASSETPAQFSTFNPLTQSTLRVALVTCYLANMKSLLGSRFTRRQQVLFQLGQMVGGPQ